LGMNGGANRGKLKGGLARRVVLIVYNHRKGSKKPLVRGGSPEKERGVLGQMEEKRDASKSRKRGTKLKEGVVQGRRGRKD